MTTWVLLRGLAREARHWGFFAVRLSQRLNGAAVVPLDLPGNGVLRAQASPRDVRAFAQACVDQLAQMRARPPFRFVALSLGGMVALDACHARPDLFDGAVLVNSSLRGYGPFWQRMRPRQWMRVAGMLAGLSSLRSREAAVLRMTSARPSALASEVERWEAIARTRPVSRLNAARQIVAAARYAPPDVPPPVPVLVLASAGDRLVAPGCSERFAQRWRLPLQLHPWAGHDLPLDDPEWVIERIADWAAGKGRRGAAATAWPAAPS